MPTIAYLANLFPSAVEPYVAGEICELRRRGAEVVVCSARRSDPTALDGALRHLAEETVCLQPLNLKLLGRALGLCVLRFDVLADLFRRVLVRGRESPSRRLRALMHTWLGACLALRLEGRGIEHIHVHHGYFSSWIALVAARLMDIGFSMTLHGSDLLVHAAYLDTKLQNCRFCLTVSSYNRRHILTNYPQAHPDKVMVQRLGVDPIPLPFPAARAVCGGGCNLLLAVGRLHKTKDHAFLIRACQRLKQDGVEFLCLIAGEGPERPHLERLIARLHLKTQVRLLGHVPHETLDLYYAMADAVVLTSRSEGIPLTLMEAMAQGKPVLAPAITGIPELVVDGKTGFLYQPGSLPDFVQQLEGICYSKTSLGPLGLGARQHVMEYFNRNTNLAAFGEWFLERIQDPDEKDIYEDLILQQI